MVQNCCPQQECFAKNWAQHSQLHESLRTGRLCETLVCGFLKCGTPKSCNISHWVIFRGENSENSGLIWSNLDYPRFEKHPADLHTWSIAAIAHPVGWRPAGGDWESTPEPRKHDAVGSKHYHGNQEVSRNSPLNLQLPVKPAEKWNSGMSRYVPRKLVSLPGVSRPLV